MHPGRTCVRGLSFNTCSSCEEQPPPCTPHARTTGFNTCSSCEEQLNLGGRVNTSGFQYMLLLRGATHAFNSYQSPISFNTCSSCEEQRFLFFLERYSMQFQYMLLLRGATHQGLFESAVKQVSIHAPLARSNSAHDYTHRPETVSIHAPLARSNFLMWNLSARRMFQYMLLLRGATEWGDGTTSAIAFQYMLLLRGATPVAKLCRRIAHVSIHAPLARSNIMFRMRCS